MRTRVTAVTSSCLLAGLLVACASTQPPTVSPGGIAVDHMVIPAAEPGGPVAAYAGFENSGAADRLLGITCECAGSVELHHVIRDGDNMTMTNSFPLDLPNGRIEVKPPGVPLHFMLIDTKQHFVAGEHVPMRLRFENAGEVDVLFRVVEKSAEGWDNWSAD